MAKNAYIGVNGVARRIPKMYIGAYFGGSGGRTECLLSGADTLIYSIFGRNYKKAYAGDAYAAFAVTGGWLAPLLVSRTANAVAYYTDGDYASGIMGYEKTVTFRGATWYVSTSGAAYQTTDIPSTANVVNINAIAGVASFSTREEAALALLNYVNWMPAGDNIARKITKGYVGINGVARQFFGRPEKLYLYNEGDECADVTGGWEGRTFSGSCTFQKNADHLLLRAGSSYLGAAFATVNSFSVAGYTKLAVEINHTSASAAISSVGLWTSIPSDRSVNGFYAGIYDRTDGERRLIYADLPQTTQNLFAAIYAVTSTDTTSCQMLLYKMWLE